MTTANTLTKMKMNVNKLFNLYASHMLAKFGSPVEGMDAVKAKAMLRGLPAAYIDWLFIYQVRPPRSHYFIKLRYADYLTSLNESAKIESNDAKVIMQSVKGADAIEYEKQCVRANFTR